MDKIGCGQILSFMALVGFIVGLLCKVYLNWSAWSVLGFTVGFPIGSIILFAIVYLLGTLVTDDN